MVQSAVSTTIRSLEEDLGVQLFDRTFRQICLTAAGETLLPEARNLLDAERRARDAVDAIDGQVKGSVSLGYMTSVNLVDVPVLLREFSNRHGRVTIKLKAAEHGTAGLVEMLHSGEVDLALVMHHEALPELDVSPVSRSPVHLCAPVGHWLVDAESVRLDQLSDEQFVDFPEGFAVRELTDTVFRAAGMARRVAFESMDVVSVGALVDNGLGVAFLPDFVSDELSHTRVVRLESDLPDMVVSIASLKRRPLSSAGMALRSVILEGREELSDDVWCATGAPGVPQTA